MTVTCTRISLNQGRMAVRQNAEADGIGSADDRRGSRPCWARDWVSYHKPQSVGGAGEAEGRQKNGGRKMRQRRQGFLLFVPTIFLPSPRWFACFEVC